MKLFWLFNDLALNQVRLLHKPVLLGTEWVYLSGLKRVNEQGQIEWVLLASYRFDADSLAQYAQRWQIESLFKALKSSGFQLESTHLTDLRRIEKLLALVALTYLWAYKVGAWLHEQKPIIRRSHQRLAQSVFRLGLDALTRAAEFKPALFTAFVLLLSCT